MCEWGTSKPWTWAADVGHLWRTTGDISDDYSHDEALTAEPVRPDIVVRPATTAEVAGVLGFDATTAIVVLAPEMAVPPIFIVPPLTGVSAA